MVSLPSRGSRSGLPSQWLPPPSLVQPNGRLRNSSREPVPTHHVDFGMGTRQPCPLCRRHTGMPSSAGRRRGLSRVGRRVRWRCVARTVSASSATASACLGRRRSSPADDTARARPDERPANVAGLGTTRAGRLGRPRGLPILHRATRTLNRERQVEAALRSVRNLDKSWKVVEILRISKTDAVSCRRRCWYSAPELATTSRQPS